MKLWRRLFWRPELIDAERLLEPAEGSELVFHLGARGLSHLAARKRLYADIFRQLERHGVVAKALRVSPASRRAAREDSRYHVFFHGRMEGPRFLNFKESYLKGFYYCDPKGFSGYSSVATSAFDPALADQSKVRRFAAEIRQDFVERERSLVVQPPSQADALPRGGIAVLLQIQDDIVLRLKRFSTADMLAMLDATRGERPLLIKRHPKCDDGEISALLAKVHDPARGIHVVEANIHHMIAASGHVAVINSGTGFEALLHGKPVLLFGEADYHHAAFPVTGTADLTAALREKGPPVDIDAYLHWFLAEQMISPRFGPMGDQILARLRERGFA